MPQHTKPRLNKSIKVLKIGILGLCLIIFGRLFQLQILQYDKYSPKSQQNALRTIEVEPARGLIFGRNGRLIVDNKPIYSLTITPADYDPENTPLLARLLGVPVKELKKRIEEARDYSWHRTSRLYTEISFKTFSLVQENIWRLPGIGHQLESKRHYPIDSLQASHILGYLGEVTKEKYQQSGYYGLGDRIGKTGLEKSYNAQLRGKKGISYILVNALGQSLGPYNGGATDEHPVQGYNLYTTLDAELQLFTEEIMEDKVGAAVALNPETGGVLCMVSAPQYKIRKLSGRIDLDYWQSINRDPNYPLFNRAISSQQPPGSTFKPVMALIGLELGLITPETTIYNPGYYYRGRRYGDHADPGMYDLVKAIQNSSNTYFLWLMDNIATSGNFDRWHELASDFGLGSQTGIDLPSEVSGILPDSAYFNEAFGEGQWGLGDIINLGIGQGRIAASPLQMALVTAILANGGYKVRPHIVRAIKRGNGKTILTETPKKKIEWIDKEEIEVVQWGMRKVVTDGSGRYYADLDSIKVAGKTGTAQNPHGEDHGWFIAFAPYEDPEIAVAVLMENAGYGSISAAPVASLIIEKYLTGTISRDYVYEYVKEFEPR